MTSKNTKKHSRRGKNTSRRGKAASRRRKTVLRKKLGRLLSLFLVLIVLRLWGPQAAGRVSSHLDIDLPEFPSISAPAQLPSAGSTAAMESMADHDTLVPDSGSFQVDFLDVGQGLSVLVEADGSYLLYDGGDRSASSYVVSFLKERGVERLDYVIASHYDSDHINGLVGALHVFEVGEVIGPDYTTDTRVYNSLISRAEELDLGITTPSPGSRYPLGQGYFEVLGPLSGSYTDVNNYSIVIRLVYGDTSVLLTGDAEAESEAELVASWPNLKSDVLCVGHHGSPSSSGDAFLDRVQPSYAIISCGKDNSYGHPAACVLQRLKERNITVYRTDESGIITLQSDGNTLSFSAEKSGC